MAYALGLGGWVMPNAINIGALAALGYSVNAFVKIDGHHCQIYGLRNTTSLREASCWIASQEGKRFSVHWNIRSRPWPVCSQLSIDGVVCAVRFYDGPEDMCFWCFPTSDFRCREFVFSAIQLTDDDEYLYTLECPPTFGTIRLEIWEADIQQVFQMQPFRHSNGAEVLKDKIIHEKSKKAGAHHVRLGEEYPMPPIMTLVNGTRRGDAPVAAFTFNYRPFDMLLAGGIIPRPAEPAQRRVIAVKSEPVEEDILGFEASHAQEAASEPRTRTASASRRAMKHWHRGPRPGKKVEVIDLFDL